MITLTATGWAVALLAAIAVGLSKGGLSMLAVLAVPILSLVIPPVQAAGLLLPVYVASDVGGLIAFRRSFDRRVLATALPGAIVGIGLGWATAHLVAEDGVRLLVGVIGLVFALNALIRPGMGRVPRTPDHGRGGLWGVLAGYTSFVSHSGAPPWQVYVQPLGLPALTFAGTTTWFFAVVNWVKLIPYAALGQLSLASLAVAAVLIPVALGSVWAGVRIVKVMPQRAFYGFITWALLLVSLRLIWVAVS